MSKPPVEAVELRDPIEPKSAREVLEQLDRDFHSYHNGSWDFSGATPIDRAVLAIEKLINEARVDEHKWVNANLPYEDERLWLKRQEKRIATLTKETPTKGEI